MVSNEENASSLYHFSFKCESFQHYPLARAQLKLSWSFWKTTGRARCGGPRNQINQGMGRRVSKGLAGGPLPLDKVYGSVCKTFGCWET